MSKKASDYTLMAIVFIIIFLLSGCIRVDRKSVQNKQSNNETRTTVTQDFVVYHEKSDANGNVIRVPSVVQLRTITESQQSGATVTDDRSSVSGSVPGLGKVVSLAAGAIGIPMPDVIKNMFGSSVAKGGEWGIQETLTSALMAGFAAERAHAAKRRRTPQPDRRPASPKGRSKEEDEQL